MNSTYRIALLVGWTLSLSAAVWAEPQQDPQRLWTEVKASLKQGAYRDALQSLEVLLSIKPNDPWAQVYHSLCELRLQSPPPFVQLSHEQLRELKARLRDEERLQRRAAAQQKLLERQIRSEQVRWDRELQAPARAKTERAQTRELAQQQAIRGAEIGQSLQRLEAQPPEQGPQPPTEAPKEQASESAPPSESAAPGKSVELAPVIVPTAAPTPAAEPVSPSLVGRPTPPAGAVQINARQMSVSPDRKIAIAEGDVEVVSENALLTCDHLTLFTDTKDVYAQGRVRLEQGKQVFRGEFVHYNFETKKGRFLQGTVASPPWYEHGRSVEHIAEGVYEVTPGYITSCELDPPHFKFYGRRAIVFADDRLARVRNATFVVEQLPFLYLPWITLADRQAPFFIIPGKRKPWGEFALMGYRYEPPGPISQKGTFKLDWRRNFGWGVGDDHQFESKSLGRGLLKLYYNKKPDQTKPLKDLPKGADQNRYRVMWRHNWQPLADTSIVTDIQKFSDIDFRKEFLFREEFTSDDVPESFISLVTNDPNFSLTGLARKRINRFQGTTDALPEVTFDVRPQPIGDTWLFSETHFDVANLQTKRANSELDDDVVRLDWFEQFKYALGLFRPIEVTPRAGIRQTFYTKDKQGSDREGQRNLFSGQFSAGVDTSLKLFRVFPVTTNVLGLDLHWLRHVLTPTIGYTYIHRPTAANDLLNFSVADGPLSQLSFGLENKLQTKRLGDAGKVRSVDLARLLISLPYTFRGNGNKQGGRLGDWTFDLETYPWPWLRLESDWPIPSHFPNSRDSRFTTWNLDLVMVGGRGAPQAQYAPKIQAPLPIESQLASGSEVQAPAVRAFQVGPRSSLQLTPEGQWYLGAGHRYSQNDKTESVVQFDWGISPKWDLSTFHRFTWKEVAGGSKRFNNLREVQYALRRDLHDWIAELIYRVDREFGEEIFFTLTLKAYPELPIQMSDSYHEPKLGSQSSPFSPIRASSSGG